VSSAPTALGNARTAARVTTDIRSESGLVRPACDQIRTHIFRPLTGVIQRNNILARALPTVGQVQHPQQRSWLKGQQNPNYFPSVFHLRRPISGTSGRCISSGLPYFRSIPRISGTAIPPRLHVCQVRCVIRGTKLVSWGHLDTPWSKPHKFATGSTRPTCRLRRRHGGCTFLRSASLSFCHVCSPAASRQQIPIRACTTLRPSILGAEPAIAHHH